MLGTGRLTRRARPGPVKRVEIEKPDGGIGLIGIPTVRDRVVQQALKSILEPIFDPGFHPSSYGYLLKMGAHDGHTPERKFWIQGAASSRDSSENHRGGGAAPTKNRLPADTPSLEVTRHVIPAGIHNQLKPI
jgi:hypothetical protein